MTPSDTNKTDNTEIDEILDDLPNAWCDDCEHPRCAGKKKATKAALETIITQRCIEELERLKNSSGDWDGVIQDRIAALNKEMEG